MATSNNIGQTAIRYSHLLLSNTEPNPAEATTISRVLRNIDTQILELDCQLAEAEREFRRWEGVRHKLRLHRKELQSQRASHEAVLSLIRRLPQEIIGEILITSMKEYDYLDRAARSHLLDLHRVCRRWRQVALSTPQLWTRLQLNLDEVKVKNINNMVGYVKAWYNRARSLPLSFLFIQNEGNPVLQTEDFYKFMVTTPWEHLSLQANAHWCSGLFKYLRRSKKKSWKELKTFQIWVTASGFDATLLPLRMMPRLKELEFFGDQSLAHSHVSLACWSSLVHPDSELSRDLEVARSILKQCVNLETCHLWANFQPKTWNPTPSLPILLPKLQSLSIIYSSPIQDFFASLVCPSLNSLELKLPALSGIRSDIDRSTSTAILDLIDRSRCKVQTLRLAKCSMSNFDIGLLLRSLPELEVLFIRSAVWTGQCLSGLEPDALPRLRHLEVQVEDTDIAPASRQSFVSFVESPSRWWNEEPVSIRELF